jgi:DNA replication protein DnaC
MKAKTAATATENLAAPLRSGSREAETLLLDLQLRQLRLPTFIHNHAKYAEDAAKANLGYERYLLSLAEHEGAQRERNQQAARIKAARFPVLKELGEFDFSAVPQLSKARVLDLARGEYIARAEPVILVGNPGLGKTHLAISLALAACRQGRKVRFYNAAALVNDLLQAQVHNQVAKFIHTALGHQLIVLDELGFIPFSAGGAQLMFQFCSALHERLAILITTNLRFADWTQVFQDERLTAALLDRLTHHAHILEFIGESYRFRQRMLRQASPTALPSLSGPSDDGPASDVAAAALNPSPSLAMSPATQEVHETES